MAFVAGFCTSGKKGTERSYCSRLLLKKRWEWKSPRRRKLVLYTYFHYQASETKSNIPRRYPPYLGFHSRSFSQHRTNRSHSFRFHSFRISVRNERMDEFYRWNATWIFECLVARCGTLARWSSTAFIQTLIDCWFVSHIDSCRMNPWHSILLRYHRWNGWLIFIQSCS